MGKKPSESPGNPSQRAFEAADGRDELNLAEFPVAVLADRAPKGQTTLVFQDQVWDQGKRQRVTRTLTVSASEKYGLPTALDDEVLIGLVQLTTRAESLSRTVYFSRYQLISLLGWRREGKSYRRLERSLKRWVGVTLYYDKAWWDKAGQSWVNESFHVLDKVTLYDKERPGSTASSAGQQAGLSSFVWNEVVFRSFQAGYLKRLDLSVYRSLRLAAAKRIYRFLDKRFYHRERWVFDLREFACEHVGISRHGDVGQLKRRLNAAFRELEDVGMLRPLASERRYVKLARGKWNVVLEKGSGQCAGEKPASETESVLQGLIDHGVTRSVARGLVEQYTHERIREKLELLDAIQQERPKAIARPAGFLVKAIRDDFAPATRSRLPAAAGRPAARRSHRSSKGSAAGRRSELKEDAKLSEETSRVQAYLESLSPGDRARIEAEAVAVAPLFLRTIYVQRLREDSPQAEWYRAQMIRHHVRVLLIERD